MVAAGSLAIAGGYAWAASVQRRAYSFRGRVVLITGGSRGLGLELARLFAAEGASIALIARDGSELARAHNELTGRGAHVLGISCDLRDRAQIGRTVDQIAARLGRIDVVVNNPGIMQVGPLDHVTLDDLDEALSLHCVAPLAVVLAALPHLRRAGGGRIVNIASIGGKVAVPHMLAYTASKFALVGLSDGLRAELHRDNILVTTVCPGPMRTGSHLHARFKGQHRREYAWFAIADSLPVLSTGSRNAARRIVRACRRGSPRLLLGLSTLAAVMLNECLPGATGRLAAAANLVLPGPDPAGGEHSRAGHESESRWSRSILTTLSRRAAALNNERPVIAR